MRGSLMGTNGTTSAVTMPSANFPAAVVVLEQSRACPTYAMLLSCVCHAAQLPVTCRYWSYEVFTQRQSVTKTCTLFSDVAGSRENSQNGRRVFTRGTSELQAAL